MTVDYKYAAGETFKAISAKIVEIIEENKAHDAYVASHVLPAAPVLPFIVSKESYAAYYEAKHEFEIAKEDNRIHDQEHEMNLKSIRSELFKWLEKEHWYMIEVPIKKMPGTMTVAIGSYWDTWGGDHLELKMILNVSEGAELPSLDRKTYN